MSDTAQIAEAIKTGVTITGELAAVAAPIVSIYNPAAGAALATLAPVITSFALTQSQILLNLNTEMTREEVIEALKKSKSANWNLTSLV